MLALPVAGLASLLPMRWIDDQRTVTEFAFLTIVYGLPMLFTFGELGYGGVASSAVGARREHRERAGPVIGAILTLYLSIAVLVSLVAVTANALGDDLGPGHWLGFPTLGTAGTVALVLASLGIPASLGARVLIGLDKAVLVIALQALPALISAALVFTLLKAGAGASGLAAALILGNLVVNIPLTVVAVVAVRGRLAPLPQLRARLAEGGFPAWANFASSVSAIALSQLPRLVLAHRGTDAAVAEIGLALVFFVPASSLVFVSGQALWSDYSHANAHGGITRSRLLGDLRHSAILGIVFAAAFAVAGPIAAHIFTPGVGRSLSLYIALAVLLLVFALDLPLNVAMLTGPMGNRRGLFITLQIPVSLVASLLIPHPTGVSLVWVQTITLLVIVFAPALWICLRDLSREHAPTEPAGVP